MDYNTYCKKNKISPDNTASLKMFYFYKEVEAASTDIKKDDMNNYATTIAWSQMCSLAPSTPQVCNSVPCVNVAESNCQKGNNPMYVNNDKHIESAKINYLNDRSSTVFYQKELPLMKQFGLIDDETPKTALDFVTRIATGKFVYKDDSKKDIAGYYYRPYEGIRWRDPAVKEDKAGYDAAYAVFLKVYQDTKDTVAIGTPAEGLAAVKALEAWTPTVATA